MPSLPIVPTSAASPFAMVFTRGADAGLDEIDKSDRLARAIERLPVRQRNTLKMRTKPRVIRGRQQTEQSVGRRVRSLAASHHLAAPLGHARTVSRLRRRIARFSIRLMLFLHGLSWAKANFAAYFRRRCAHAAHLK